MANQQSIKIPQVKSQSKVPEGMSDFVRELDNDAAYVTRSVNGKPGTLLPTENGFGGILGSKNPYGDVKFGVYSSGSGENAKSAPMKIAKSVLARLQADLVGTNIEATVPIQKLEDDPDQQALLARMAESDTAKELADIIEKDDKIETRQTKASRPKEPPKERILVQLQGDFGRYRGQYLGARFEEMSNIIILTGSSDDPSYTPPLDKPITLKFANMTWQAIFKGVEFSLPDYGISVIVFEQPKQV